jgi:hypothetical protein
MPLGQAFLVNADVKSQLLMITVVVDIHMVNIKAVPDIRGSLRLTTR